MPPLDLPLRHRTNVLFRSLLSHRIQLYSVASVVAVSAVILNALRNYSNFYSVAIYLSRSGRSVLALANFAILLALFFGHIVQRIFFGSLRANEVERLYDRLWFFITESLLAFTIFRDEFDIPFVLMFGFLLFVKSFHWLASDRIEWMDQQPYPGPSALFHLRMTSLFLILWLTDFIMFVVAIDHTATYGVGGMVLFASEYGILMATIMNTILKYILSAYELRRAGRRGGENAPPWENKSMWVFYVELTTDFLKLTTYLVFFTIIITFYGLPLNIIRDVYITARSFITRLRALHRYQTATRNMDERYPNATEAELTTMSDRTCIICREEMALPEQGQAATQDGPNVTPKKLPCGHIFHFHCLRSWLERQQSCPTCRQTVLETNTPQRPANRAAPAPAPQQENNAGDVQPANNNGPNNNPLGNPLGLLGRILGPPGQVANRNPVAPARVVQTTGGNGQNNPIVIEYHIQYQIPRTPGATPTTTRNPPASLQPIQPLEGFAGPNGVWQRWPNHDVAPVQTDTPTEPVQTSPLGENSADSHPADAQDLDGTENTDTENPRTAAALAALRRSNGDSPASKKISPPLSASSTDKSLGKTPESRVHTSPPTVPQLIPLFNLSAPPPTQTFPNKTTPPAVLSQDTPLLSQLPRHITDAQLALMDELTREAIDERLRILENVSGTVYQCVEDLLRLRSALPVTQVLTENFQQDVSHEVNGGVEGISGNDNFSVRTEGKGKAVDRSTEHEPGQSMSKTSGSSASGVNSPRQEEGGSEDSFEMY